MITDSYSAEMGVRSVLSRGTSNDYNEELGRLLRERASEHEASDRETELSRLRSGSAPPIVQGSLGASFLDGNIGSYVSKEELRSDLAYSSYYCKNVNLNPGLPPPLPAIGDRRKMTQNGGGSGGGGGGGGSLFAMQPGFGGSKEEHIMQGKEWSADGLIGFPGLGLGSKQNSIADMVKVENAVEKMCFFGRFLELTLMLLFLA